jgi:hypothetical protein
VGLEDALTAERGVEEVEVELDDARRLVDELDCSSSMLPSSDSSRRRTY